MLIFVAQILNLKQKRKNWLNLDTESKPGTLKKAKFLKDYRHSDKTFPAFLVPKKSQNIASELGLISHCYGDKLSE